MEGTVNNLQDLHVESIQGTQSHLKAIKLRKGTSEIKELILCLFVNLKVIQKYNNHSLNKQGHLANSTQDPGCESPKH